MNVLYFVKVKLNFHKLYCIILGKLDLLEINGVWWKFAFPGMTQE